MSESEAELDGPHNEVELPQAMASRGNMKTAKSAIRWVILILQLGCQLLPMFSIYMLYSSVGFYLNFATTYVTR